MTARKRPTARLLCTRRGCGATAMFVLQGEYGRPWLGCTAHADAMQKSLGLGQRIDYTVTSTAITPTVRSQLLTQQAAAAAAQRERDRAAAADTAASRRAIGRAAS